MDAGRAGVEVPRRRVAARAAATGQGMHRGAPRRRRAARVRGRARRLDPGDAVPCGSARAGGVPRLRGPQRIGDPAVRRLPQIAFAALIAATVAAFFITQHLKVSTPLVAGPRGPSPAVFNPLSGISCGDPPVDYRRTSISFYLLHRSDDVDVDIVDQGGTIVRTLASGVHMRGGAHPVRRLFVWNGREDSGRIAPDGTYYVRVALIHQGRTVTISDPSGPAPVKVKATPPAPVVKSATPHLIPNGSSSSVTIAYAGNEP